MRLDMKGEVAIVMASSSGLGLGAAIALAMEGANVVINGRDKDRLESAKIKIEKVAMGEVICCQGDISERETAVKLVETAMENFGRLDHLVTNSGPPPCLRFEQSNDEDWYNAFDSLFMGIIRVIKEAEPHLKKSKNGTIVTITSRIVKEPSPANILSSSIRMAVVGLGKSLAQEFAPQIRVNTVLPGKFDTPRVVDDVRDVARKIPNSEFKVEGIPMGRIGDPIELGNAVAFLCSNKSSFINGAALQVDGGTIKGTF